MMDGLMDAIKVFFNGVGIFFILYLIGYSTFLFLSVVVGASTLYLSLIHICPAAPPPQCESRSAPRSDLPDPSKAVKGEVCNETDHFSAFEGSGTVSYTHLDVYKRQREFRKLVSKYLHGRPVRICPQYCPSVAAA